MTRLLPNVIKSRHVYLNDPKYIDSNEKMNQIFKSTFNNITSNFSNDEYVATDENVFREGLNATRIEHIADEYNENAQADFNKVYEDIVEDAKKEAEQIIQNAKLEGQKMCEQLYAEAKRKGYEEGKQAASVELEIAKKHFREQEVNLNIEYQQKLSNLEPDICSILIELLDKLTGIVIEDKKDIILYLIHNALLHSDSSKSYVIKVSMDDYEYVLSKKDELLEYVSGDSIVFEISLDRELNKNQCLIETDSSVIDCSLDIQLSSLIQDIKMLSLQV